MSNNITGKTIFSVTSITLLSRLLSLMSVQIYISKFGFEDIYLQIFMYALLLPNTIFTSIGTLLTTIVVPVYSSLLSKNNKDEAKHFLDNIISISSVAMVLLVLIGLIIAPLFVSFSNFNSNVYNFNYAVFAVRILIPVMFFNGLCFIFQGILQSHQKFNLVAAVTVPTSFITILYVIFLGDSFGVTGLLICTLIGLSSQALILLPGVVKTGYKFKVSFNYRDENTIYCIKMIFPVLIGVSSYQVNTLFNGIVATNFNIVHIQFVQNIILTSVLSFIYSVTAVYYPKLSVLWSSGNLIGYKESLADVISMILFMLIPITFGFIGVRYSFFDLLANYGRVKDSDIFILGNLLSLYSIGIIAVGFKEVTDRAFYAQNNTKVSAFAGFIIMILNIIISLSLIKYLGVYAMPISYVISTSIGVIILVTILIIKIGSLNKGFIVYTLKCMISAIFMFILVEMQSSLLNNYFQDDLTDRIIKLFVPVIVGVLVYFLSTYILKVPTGIAVINKILKIK